MCKFAREAKRVQTELVEFSGRLDMHDKMVVGLGTNLQQLSEKMDKIAATLNEVVNRSNQLTQAHMGLVEALAAMKIVQIEKPVVEESVGCDSIAETDEESSDGVIVLEEKEEKGEDIGIGRVVM